MIVIDSSRPGTSCLRLVSVLPLRTVDGGISQHGAPKRLQCATEWKCRNVNKYSLSILKTHVVVTSQWKTGTRASPARGSWRRLHKQPPTAHKPPARDLPLVSSGCYYCYYYTSRASSQSLCHFHSIISMANRQLLARATEGTSAPTPGYLYNDLTQSAQSSPTAASEMADYLVNRLQSTHNVHTKAKCLTVIGKLCDSSVPFKRSLAQRPQHVQAIRDAIRHAGAPDPVCGDALNLKVRQVAQQALDAVYRADPVVAAAPPSHYYGNNSHAAAPAYGQSQSQYNNPNQPRRMEGIGNPRYQDPRLEQPGHNNNAVVPAAVIEVAREAGDVILGMMKDPLARNHHVQRHGNLPGSPNKYNNGSRVGELNGGSGVRITC